MTGEIGTVKVKVTTTNYEDFQLTLVLNAVKQITPVPDGTSTITATPITYGNELSASTITGTMQDPATSDAVNGTFTWDTPAVKLNAGSHDAKWTYLQSHAVRRASGGISARTCSCICLQEKKQ